MLKVQICSIRYSDLIIPKFKPHIFWSPITQRRWQDVNLQCLNESRHIYLANKNGSQLPGSWPFILWARLERSALSMCGGLGLQIDADQFNADGASPTQVILASNCEDFFRQLSSSLVLGVVILRSVDMSSRQAMLQIVWHRRLPFQNYSQLTTTITIQSCSMDVHLAWCNWA